MYRTSPTTPNGAEAAVGSRYVSHGDLPMQKDRRNELRVSEIRPPSRFAFLVTDPG